MRNFLTVMFLAWIVVTGDVVCAKNEHLKNGDCVADGPRARIILPISLE